MKDAEKDAEIANLRAELKRFRDMAARDFLRIQHLANSVRWLYERTDLDDAEAERIFKNAKVSPPTR